ncbi:MAG TPA: hypothetical protein DDW50_11110 [Firmicutes bacterium]|nr:hypothetical protein [Bacillota bacterium]
MRRRGAFKNERRGLGIVLGNFFRSRSRVENLWLRKNMPVETGRLTELGDELISGKVLFFFLIFFTPLILP